MATVVCVDCPDGVREVARRGTRNWLSAVARLQVETTLTATGLARWLCVHLTLNMIIDKSYNGACRLH
jgi:hypothetical protein